MDRSQQQHWLAAGASLLMTAGAALLLSACAAGSADGDQMRCATVLTVAPPQPRAGTTIALTASTSGEVGVGFERFSWSVYLGSEAVALAAAEPEGPVVSLVAERAGTYQIAVEASVGDERCDSAQEQITVIASDAGMAQYRLRLVPPADLAAPLQDIAITVFGGVDAYLGSLALDIGAVARLLVTTDAGQPVAAYVRLTPTDDPQAPGTEAFTGGGGSSELWLESRRYDVLVVPEDPHLAPAHFDGRRIFELELELAPGTPITGTVVDGQGQPLAGARISLRTSPQSAPDSFPSVPSTLGTTDAGGAFVLAGRPGHARGLTVVPPPASGLPLLERAPAVELASASSLAIGYAPVPTRSSVAPRVVLSDGASPAPAARAIWLGTIAQAGTVSATSGSALPVSGAVRVVHSADAAGALPPVDLPAALYQVLLEPAAGHGVTVLSVDLRAGSPVPQTLALAPATRLGAMVQDAQGQPVAGARVTAVPIELLAQAATATATAATSAPDGRVELALVAGGTYELVVDSPDPHHARMRQAVRVPLASEPASLGALQLRPAIQVSGRLVIPGQAGGAGRVSLRSLCMVCSDAEAREPLAEARADKAGYFTISVPDPGVQ